MHVREVQLLLAWRLRVALKIESATIVHAAAVAFRSKALPGADDREQLAH
jgi:hypothetical protein